MRRIVKEIILRIAYLSGVWIAYRWATRRRVRILMYHGVTDGDIGVWTQVPAASFEAQMAYVRRRFTVIGLPEAYAILKGLKKPPAYSLVITFDDGFLNNRTQAYSALKQHGLPAAIFLTTSFVNKTSRFEGLLRTDYMLCLFRQSPLDRLDLSDCGLGSYALGSREQRTRVAYRVSGALKRMNHVEENRIIDIIAQRLGASLRESDVHAFRSLDWADIRELHAEGLITFGAHTVSHEILTMIPRDRMVWEIEQSQNEIERCLESPVRFFAYPNGTRSDFDEDIKSEVAARFDCALSTLSGLNSPGTDLFELRRIGIGNDTELWKFRLELSGLIGIMGRLKARLAAKFPEPGRGRAASKSGREGRYGNG